MRILLLSGYDAVSHRYWRKGLVEHFPEHEWTVLTLPDRYFSWRLRGNSLTWAMGPEREILEQPWDRVIATSMVDLASLRGMVPSLAQVPTTVYFHENQFAYPRSGHQAFSPVEPQLQSLYTALCGEHLVFNTEYNRDTFFHGAAQLLKKLPDHVPAGVVEFLQARSRVIPVPLADDVPDAKAEQILNPDSLLVAWAARWEYDKGPDRLLSIITGLEASGLDYQLCILGQAFRKQPPEFEQIRETFGHRLSHFGYAESREDYLNWLSRADILLSTSRHEFQGISVMEGVACGAWPVLPNEQSYPCLFGDDYLYDSDEQAVNKIVSYGQQKLSGKMNSPVPNMGKYRWNTCREAYQQVL
ncbi:tRNA-queuosine alpha-mannosyltransferase domain-containing protein [Parendozoicomonas haliclonae]|uniref:tRNA-queuosine alpha-mannosyltransferase n=1 Tax=Parendozoicomonas haliclonae TaxID=1960125 RepID=A0A1X7APY9_9GAMM|nr:DUF3524 domain-containing protein [Parendozoicomonas haliclonae]SMA50391.1 Glycosyl transferases group 1 [Parendozoicomonas haliclonae]